MAWYWSKRRWRLVVRYFVELLHAIAMPDRAAAKAKLMSPRRACKQTLPSLDTITGDIRRLFRLTLSDSIMSSLQPDAVVWVCLSCCSRSSFGACAREPWKAINARFGIVCMFAVCSCFFLCADAEVCKCLMKKHIHMLCPSLQDSTALMSTFVGDEFLCSCRPIATPQQISRAWPYGVRQERVEGRQVAWSQLRANTNYT